MCSECFSIGVMFRALSGVAQVCRQALRRISALLLPASHVTVCRNVEMSRTSVTQTKQNETTTSGHDEMQQAAWRLVSIFVDNVQKSSKIYDHECMT